MLTSYLNQKFKPMYTFDLNGIGRWLDRIRLKGKYPMYTAQKHVTAAVTRGFQDRDSILLVGSDGNGQNFNGGLNGYCDGLRCSRKLTWTNPR